MRPYRFFNKIITAILVAAIAISMLASCASNTPSLDLSQNDPFAQAPSDTTAEQTFDDISSETSPDASDTDLDTEEETDPPETTEEETTEEETEPVESFPTEINGVTMIYFPTGDSTCTISTIVTEETALVIPEEIDGYTVTGLSGSAFGFARSIEKLTLPSGLTSIGSSAFLTCTALREVHVASVEDWLEISFGNASANPLYHARRLFVNGSAVQEVRVPDGTTRINPFAFYNCYTISSLYIPDSLTSIGTNAFQDSRLAQVYISDLSVWFGISFDNAGANPLGRAKRLYINEKRTSEIVVPDSVTEIKPFCFYGFEGISLIEIHGGVTSIGASAFLDCSYMTGVVIRDIGAWCSVNFANESANPLSIAKTLLYRNGATVYPVSAIEVPATVGKIAPYAFVGCTNIVAVTFAEGSQLSVIGTGAFKDCTALATIYIPETVSVIESLAFSMCPSISSYFEFNGANYLGSFSNPCHALMSLVIGEGQVESTITSFTVPSTTKIIYQAAFAYSTKLESVVISDSVQYIGNSAFYSCTALKDVTLGSGLTEIGNSVFCNCSAIETLSIPEGVRVIGRSALSGCSSLTSLSLPSTLTYIDQYAFRDCRQLKQVNIPASVNYIGNCAFLSCNTLDSVTFGALSGWKAENVNISSTDLRSSSIAAFFLREDYVLKEWTRS